MGAVVRCCNEGLIKLLMPPQGSCTMDWYGFGPAEPNSLLCIGHIRLEIDDGEAARRFYEGCLGAAVESSGGSGGELCVRAGPSRLLLASADGPAKRWPGQFYVWVEDIQAVWSACKALQAQTERQVIVEELCLKDETKVDVLVLQDAPGGNLFVVNQAPKGYSKMAANAGWLPEATGGRPANLLALMDVQRNVPVGAAANIAEFYRQVLGANGTRLQDGARVEFAAGDTVRQNLTFKEDPDVRACEPSQFQDSICLYLPSPAKFRLAYGRCEKAGVVVSPGGWPEAEKAGEFRLRAPCGAGGEGAPSLDFEHVIRSSAHAELPVKAAVAGEATDALMGA